MANEYIIRLSKSALCQKEALIHGRDVLYNLPITSQKGIAVLTAAIPAIIENFPNVRFIIAGQGEPRYEIDLVHLTEQYPGKITFMNGYNQAIVRLVTAMCDFIVLPSFFEPCGLEDFIAQSYGTLPIAHKTGGLNKIVDGKTGFLYEDNTHLKLTEKILWVADFMNKESDSFLKMIKEAAASVQGRYLWENVVKNKYLKFFEEILKKSEFSY